MNSFNHYAYGAVGDWMYRVVAGLDLDPRAPGYKHSFIRPQPGGGLTEARASIETVYGPLASAWRQGAGRFELEATVPANTTSTVRLPGARLEQVSESGRPARARRLRPRAAYNTARPHRALGRRPPAAYSAQLAADHITELSAQDRTRDGATVTNNR